MQVDHVPSGDAAQAWFDRETVLADMHDMSGKPTYLVRQLARICEEDDHILDPFAG